MNSLENEVFTKMEFSRMKYFEKKWNFKNLYGNYIMEDLFLKIMAVLFGMTIGYYVGELFWCSVSYHGPNPNIMNKIIIKKKNTKDKYYSFTPVEV
jgi:hypothetical protein